jgi:hypothetical protein
VTARADEVERGPYEADLDTLAQRLACSLEIRDWHAKSMTRDGYTPSMADTCRLQAYGLQVARLRAELEALVRGGKSDG